MRIKPRAFFRTSKLMLPGALIGARYTSGWSTTLLRWRLAIDDSGNLYQEMSIFKPGNHLDNTPQQIHTVIGQAAVLDLLLQAEAIGFATFAEQPADIVDDAPTYTLSFRLDQHETTVFRYEVAPHILEQDEQLKNFMSLWEAVHKYAPLRNAAE